MYNQFNPYLYRNSPKTFNFSSLLNNTQKTLNIINQTIPIIKEVRPIVKNASTLFKVAKGFNSINKDPIIKTKPENNNGLNFFV